MEGAPVIDALAFDSRIAGVLKRPSSMLTLLLRDWTFSTVFTRFMPRDRTSGIDRTDFFLSNQASDTRE
jgi:hypothetical protein